MSFRMVAAVAVLGVVLAACTSGGPAAAPSSAPARPAPAITPATTLSRTPGARPVAAAPAHTVIVLMENHSYGELIGSPQAPYINELARGGALFTDSRAITHPSQPNYLALFAGSTQGVTDDSCPHQFTAANLASELIAAGRSFVGYAEGLPAVGSPVCGGPGYARKHVPWANFSNVPAADSHPFAR